MNKDLAIGTEVILSKHSLWIRDCPGPWNPVNDIGKLCSQEQWNSRVSWKTYNIDGIGVRYEPTGSDLLPLVPVKSRRIARDIAQYNGLVIEDFGPEAGDQRWQVTVKEI